MDYPVDVLKTAAACKTNGATPLVIAAKNGHFQAVKFLVQEFNADIEQVRHLEYFLMVSFLKGLMRGLCHGFSLRSKRGSLLEFKDPKDECFSSINSGC